MTFALIMLVFFLVIVFREIVISKKEKKNEIRKLTITNITLQKEIFLKWFDIISKEITEDEYENNPSQPMHLGGAINRSYLRHNIPNNVYGVDNLDICDFWQSHGKELHNEILHTYIYADKLPTIDAYDMVYMAASSYEIQYGISPKEKYCLNSAGEDWRIWFMYDLGGYSGDEGLSKKDIKVIRYALFKEKIDDIYNQLVAADVARLDERSDINGFRHVNLYCGNNYVCEYDHIDDILDCGSSDFHSKSCLPRIPDDDSEKSKAYRNIIDSIPIIVCSRMETILLEPKLRAYFLNLICLLTRKELTTEHKLAYNPSWDYNITGGRPYVGKPPEKMAEQYPWLFM